MAKRLSDTNKWDKAWFRNLAPGLKCLWFFLCDKCDHAGVWEIDEGAIEFYVGFQMPLPDIFEVFGDRVRQISPTKLWLPGFVEFQYGALNPQSRVHNSVIKILKRHNLLQFIPLGNPIDSIKEKEKEKEKDKDKEKEKGSGEEEKPLSPKTGAWLDAVRIVRTKHNGVV